LSFFILSERFIIGSPKDFAQSIEHKAKSKEQGVKQKEANPRCLAVHDQRKWIIGHFRYECKAGEWSLAFFQNLLPEVEKGQFMITLGRL